MATRKKRQPKRPQRQSSVAAAQRAAQQRLLERDEKRTKQVEEAAKKAAAQPKKSGALGATQLEPRTDTPMANAGRGVDQDEVAKRDNIAGRSMSEAANKIAGLAQPVMKARQEERRALADPALFGVSDKRIKDRITAQKNALDDARRKALAKTGSAVFFGYKNEQIRRPQRGGEFEGGTNRTPQSVQMDDIRSKEELMSWLADETVFGQIKKRMQSAGLDVQSYDDVAKLWKAVVDQAAATYSTTGKKVTPWAILSLRSKNMDANGKPASRTTTSTTVEEMDPAQARLMVERSATEFLGRAPRPEELEDFIAKAQTIARHNPNVTTTTTKYDFAGDPVSSSSMSRGGADVVSAKAQIAAEDAAKQDEEYGAYQAAGVYMPWLMDALASPI